MRVQLDALTFNDLDNNAPDSMGCQWYLTKLDGWDAPSQRLATQDPTSRHGSVPTESMLGTRPLVLEVVCKAQDETGFWAGYNYILGLTNNIYGTREFKVTEGTVEKVVNVIRASEPKLEIVGLSTFTANIPLVAMDPLKYGTTPTVTTIPSGQTKVLVNDGTFDSTAITITTSGTGLFMVTNTGNNNLSITAWSPPDGTIFDFQKRSALNSSGQSQYGQLFPGSVWWGLQPGANSIKNAGQSSVTIKHYSAWI